MKVGDRAVFWERVMAGCEMLPCGLSQESSGGTAELPSTHLPLQTYLDDKMCY